MSTNTLTSQEAEFVERLKTVPADASGKPAWDGARQYGAAVVRPLTDLLAHENFEVARNAKRALAEIVHERGRPGASREAQEIEAELLRCLRESNAKRDLLWLLSEIAGDTAVPSIAAFLDNPELREDARCVLMRIPGSQAVSALRAALGKASGDFKAALAEALRARGERVTEPASQKMIPRKQTSVTPKQ